MLKNSNNNESQNGEQPNELLDIGWVNTVTDGIARKIIILFLKLQTKVIILNSKDVNAIKLNSVRVVQNGGSFIPIIIVTCLRIAYVGCKNYIKGKESSISETKESVFNNITTIANENSSSTVLNNIELANLSLFNEEIIVDISLIAELVVIYVILLIIFFWIYFDINSKYKIFYQLDFIKVGSALKLFFLVHIKSYFKFFILGGLINFICVALFKDQLITPITSFEDLITYSILNTTIFSITLYLSTLLILSNHTLLINVALRIRLQVFILGFFIIPEFIIILLLFDILTPFGVQVVIVNCPWIYFRPFLLLFFILIYYCTIKFSHYIIQKYLKDGI